MRLALVKVTPFRPQKNMVEIIRRRVHAYLHLGVKDSNSAELNRQIFVVNLFAAVGLTITFALFLSALTRSEYWLAFSLLTASFTFYVSHLFLRFEKLKNGYRISANCLMICLMALMVFLVYSGGAKNTGPLWIYLVPPVALFLGGLKKGLRDLAAFVVVISVIMFFPDDKMMMAVYSFEFKTRLLYSFLTVTFLSAVYEYSRQQSYIQIQELSDKFEQQARRDPLTQLPNRRGMREHLEYEKARNLRSKQNMTLLLCDIDHFKRINDNFGHDAGDSVLKQISGIFLNSLRKQDIVSRWGGEEFLFMLPETNVHEGRLLAEKIRHKVINSDFHHNNRKITCTVSLGVSEVSQAQSIEDAINQADHFLYQAKEHGRNMTLPEANNLN